VPARRAGSAVPHSWAAPRAGALGRCHPVLIAVDAAVVPPDRPGREPAAVTWTRRTCRARPKVTSGWMDGRVRGKATTGPLACLWDEILGDHVQTADLVKVDTKVLREL
jgi:hypothetical protein